MTVVKTRAVVIKTQEYKEADKLVWLFTEKLGKITTIAKGARKSKSKFLSSTLPFCYGEFVLYKGRSLYTINEGTVIDTFQEFLRDLETISYASYLNEMIDIVLQEEEANEILFKNLVMLFYFMKNKVGDMELLTRAFEVKVLQVTGYGLNLEYCTRCRGKIKISNYIDFQYGGGICKECEKTQGIYISHPTYNTLKFLNTVTLDKIPRMMVSEQTKKELYTILSHLIAQNYARKPKSLHMFDYLKEENSNE